jgi:hypothetical protein
MLNESCPVVCRILDAEWLPWEELLLASLCLKPCPDSGYNATMRAGYREVSEAADLQQAPYSWVIDGRYYIQGRKAEMKPSDLHEVPGGIEELKSFVGIVGRPLPRVCGSVIVKI